MTGEQDETASPEKSEEDLNDQLRKELHAQIDNMCARAKTGLDIHLECLVLAGRLLKAGTPAIDLFVGHELVSSSKTTALTDALAAGTHARDNARASVFWLDGKTAKSSARGGLLGAFKTVEQLAVYSDDPYLKGLATALGQLRHGQLHPWLAPPRAVAHPKQYASHVLGVKVIPFGVIEYLVASGLYSTKSEATGEVVARLDISEDTLNDWRKKQRRYNAAAFDVQRSSARSLGEWVGGYRRKVKEVPSFRSWIEYQDQQFGLSAVDRCAQR